MFGLATAISLELNLVLYAGWLSGFAYTIDNNVQILTIASVTVLLMAFLTICYQATNVAFLNPVDSLKVEL